ncbi:hypothetical protein MANAM107_10920 [Actinomyces capricornis]|uniref:Restriction endonuclease type II DpnII-like domain-containing protein n=2 Tax=Actinomyces capricornis TaxID=2755559 RepID=A0ABM7UA41_9ACTO|nr:hypothetical protein MANAM107_10920 [Actinomyces capricornis]
MDARIPDFQTYLDSLSRLTPAPDLLRETERTIDIRSAALLLESLHEISQCSLTRWLELNPRSMEVLFLSVGISAEKAKNILRDQFGTSGSLTLARTRSADVIGMLDEQFDIVRMLQAQCGREYSFGDVLVARAGGRSVARQAGLSGRLIEDQIEGIARDLGLRCAVRTRFEGVHGMTAPCDLAIPGGGPLAQIVVAAKGFDSTGSKLTDAVREVQEMANVRRPDQYVFAVVDGIGWKSRQADLRRIHRLWEQRAIDGCFTLSSMEDFRSALARAARRCELVE